MNMPEFNQLVLIGFCNISVIFTLVGYPFLT